MDIWRLEEVRPGTLLCGSVSKGFTGPKHEEETDSQERPNKEDEQGSWVPAEIKPENPQSVSGYPIFLVQI